MITIASIQPTVPQTTASGSITINGLIWAYTVRLRANTGLLDFPRQRQQLDLIRRRGQWYFACPCCWRLVAGVVLTSSQLACCSCATIPQHQPLLAA